MSARRTGNSVQVVRRRLSDGSIREYRYDRGARARKKYQAAARDALKQISQLYYQSPEYAALSPQWQKVTRYYVNLLLDHLGWMTFTDIGDRRSRQDFYEVRDAYAATPAKADKLMNVLRALLNFGYERAMIDANHAHGIPRLTPANRTRAENIWLPEHRQPYLTAAKPWMQRLFTAALYTTARQADLCRMTWDMFDGEWLTFTPTKTARASAVKVFLPVYALDPLRALIDALPRHPHGFIFATDEGVPLTVHHVRREARLTRVRAGIDADLTFHDLRGTGETEMLESGCTEAETSSILGHALVRGSGQKSYAARTRRLALNAYTKWNAALSREGEVIPLKTGL